jgi:uncharacterized protein YdeI (YjbR/CyaY-like superfamily)
LKTVSNELPVLAFDSQASWEAWLAENQELSDGIWLKIAKKETGIPTVDYSDAVDSALCYGWIDGQKASFDEQYWLQKFTPRRPKSLWSKRNCERAEALIAQGRMQPAGLKQVEAARADGRWDAAYESQRTITVPDDLQVALENNQAAKEFFDALNSTNRYAILHRIVTAKKPETRAARIKKFVEMLSKGEKLYP